MADLGGIGGVFGGVEYRRSKRGHERSLYGAGQGMGAREHNQLLCGDVDLDGGDVRSVESSGSGVDGVLSVAARPSLADAADLSLLGGGLGDSTCVVVGLPSLLCGFCRAREFGESDARGGIADDVRDDGADHIIDCGEKGDKYRDAPARGSVFDTGGGKCARIFNEWGVVYVDGLALGNGLYFGIFVIDGSGARAG